MATRDILRIESVNETNVEDVRIQLLSFSVSILAASAFVLQVTGLFTVPAIYIVLPILSYPFTRLVFARSESPRLDLAYIVLSFIGLAGVLGYGTVFPAGYGDVGTHITSTKEIVQLGSINLQPHPSSNFPVLYLLSYAIMGVTNLQLAQYAPHFPILMLPFGFIVFYWSIAGRLLPTNEALFATLLFGFNWGVFRFNVEFRTLNVAFPLILLLLAIFISNEEKPEIKPRVHLLTLMLLTGLVLSHISSFMFFTVFLAIFAVVSYFVHSRRIYLFYIVFGLTVLLAYTIWFSSTTVYTMTVVIGSLVKITSIGGSVGAGGAGTGSGLPFGRVVYYAQWILRAGFVVSFGLFVISRGRRWSRAFLFMSSVAFGGFLAAALVSSFVLTAARVYTFFAIPYALVFGVGYLALKNPQFYNVRGISRIEQLLSSDTVWIAGRVLVAVILVSAAITGVMKFPSYLIGPTEPIREDDPSVDQYTFLSFDNRDLQNREFLEDQTTSSETIQMVSTSGVGGTQGFYIDGDIEASILDDSGDQAPGNRLVSTKINCAQPDADQYVEEDICTPYRQQIYGNGKNQIYVVPGSVWEAEAESELNST